MSRQPGVCVVSGASGAVGAAVVGHLAGRGLRVVASGRDRAALEQLTLEHDTDLIVLDVGRLEGRDDAERIADVAARLGGASVLCNASGAFGPICHPSELALADFEHAVRVNTMGPVALSLMMLPKMLTSGWGRIINVSSAQTLHPPDAYVMSYATSKHALNVATRCIAAQTSGTAVAACVVHPGNVRSAMWRQIQGDAQRAGAGHLSEWATRVDADGGDEPALTARLVGEIIDREAHWSNGRFLTVPGGFDQHPVPW